MILSEEDMDYNTAKQGIKEIIGYDIQEFFNNETSLQAAQKHLITQTIDKPIFQSSERSLEA